MATSGSALKQRQLVRYTATSVLNYYVHAGDANILGTDSAALTARAAFQQPVRHREPSQDDQCPGRVHARTR